ncbi:MAG: M56 family metallopeptidase [Polyangiaceae bacterium]
MSVPPATLVAFNLLLNGVGSFAIGWVVAALARRAFRPRPGPADVALHALPFAKLAIDLVAGVPSGSFLWLRAAGVPQDLGSFQIGWGLSYIVPEMRFHFGALSDGRLYAQSAPDLVAALLTKRVGPWAPGLATFLLGAVAATRLASRVVSFVRASEDRTERRARASLVGRRRVGLRSVEILVSDEPARSPFTGGVLRPFVCFARPVWSGLTPLERRAALAHEIAHIRHHHLALVTAVGFVRDVFWFVPFIGRAEQRLREGCELAADDGAVSSGVAPELLASALVRSRELLGARSLARASAPLAVLRAHGSALGERVVLLLDGAPRARLGFDRPWLRAALLAWVGAIAMRSVAFGNW